MPVANTSNISTIQILRSYANSTPLTLQDGQLAFSFLSNTLFIGSNTGGIIAISDQTTANLARQLSNTIIGIQGVDVSQNARMTIIEGVDVTQNAIISIIQGVDVGQNNRMAISDAVNVSQNVRLDYSNTAITIIQGVDVGQNTAIGATDGKMLSAYNQANTGTVLAQGAFDKANTNNVITGNVSISNNLSVANTITTNVLNISTNTSNVSLTRGTGITSWNYSGKFKSISAEESNPTGLFLSPDGLNMYVNGSTGDDVNQYTLSTAWNVSTATFVRLFSTGTQDSSPQDIFFKPDGLSMFIIGASNDTVFQYTLSSAFDISTASYASKSFNVNSQESSPLGLWFKPDGTVMYIIGSSSDIVFQYTLSTAWDVSTASYASILFSVAAQDSNPTQVNLSADGLTMWILGSSSDKINQYALGTAFNVSTAVFENSFYIGFQETSPQGLFINSTAGNNYVYLVGQFNDTVFQYNADTNSIAITTDVLTVDNNARIQGNLAVQSSAYVDGSALIQGALSVGGSTTLSTTSVSGTLSATSTLSGTSTITLSGSGTSTTTLGTSATTGTTTIGGTSQTANITFGQSTLTQTANVAIGNTAAGSTKTIDFGINAGPGSNTRINIGPTHPGANGNVTFNPATTVAIQNTRTSISNTTGALTVLGGVGVSGNVNSDAVYSGGYFYRDGTSITNTANNASANTIITQGVDASQNVRIDYSNSAITIIQGVDVGQNNRMAISDGVNATQNVRLDYSNTAITIIQGVDVGQNARMVIIEGTDASQNVRLDFSNTRMTIIEGVDVTQNTNIAATNQYAASAFSTANNAFTKANNALANTTGTFAGNLTVTGNVIANSFTTSGSSGNISGANFVYANTFVSSNAYIFSDGSVQTTAASASLSNAAYNQANTATVLAQAAYNQANVTIGVDATQNTRLTVIEGTNASQNVRLDYSNTAITIIQGVDVTQNTRLTVSEGVNLSQNVRLDFSNTRMNIIDGVDAGQNARMTIIEGVDVTQNTNIANRLALSGVASQTVTGNVVFGNDVTVTGNLVVLGNTISLNVTSFEVEDTLIQLGIGNYYTDALTIGYVGHYNDGTNAHAGMIRDAVTKEFYAFQGYTPEASGNVINVNAASFTKANIHGNWFKGNLIATTARVGGLDVNSRLDFSNTRMTIIEGVDVTQNTNIAATDGKMQSAYNVANTADVRSVAAYFHANGAFIKANAAFDQANVTIGVDASQNSRMTIIEGTDLSQNVRLDYSNTALTIAQGVDNSQNVRIDYSNAAITIIQGVDTSQNARMVIIEGTDVSQNARMTIADGVDASQNSRLDYSNTAITIIQGIDTSQNARMVIIEGTDVSQNARMVIIEGTDVSQNARMTISDGVNASQNVRLDYSNTALTIAQGVDDSQNVRLNYSNTVINQIQSAWTPNTVIVANNTGYLANSNMRWDNVQNQLILGFTGATGNLAIGTTTSVAPITVVKGYSTPTGGEQFGSWIQTAYNIADTSLKQGLRLNTSTTHTSNTISNAMGLLNLTTAGGVGGTTAAFYGHWSRNDVTAGSYVTNSYNYFVTDSGGTGNANNQFGFYTTNLTKGLLSNYGFYGAVNTGNNAFNLYMAGTAPNYLAGSLTVANNVPSTSNTTGSLVVTGGVGISGNTFLNNSLAAITTTPAAVNYLQVSGNTTGNAPTISVQGTDANTDFNIISKGTGVVNLNTGSGTQVRIIDSGGTAVNRIHLQGQATGFLPVIASRGSDTNLGMSYSTQGTGGHDFYTATTSFTQQFKIAHTASAVNYLTTTGQATGSSPQIYAAGTDSNVGINLATKGTGNYGFFTNTFAQQQFAINHTASAVNYIQVAGNVTGQQPYFLSAGSDTNVGITYATKGTGSHFFSSGGGVNYQFNISNTNSAVNYLQATGNTTGGSPILSGQGSDTNVGININPKGAGSVNVTSTASSTSNTTGALVVTGGMGITGNLFMSAANNFFSTTNGLSYRLGWTDNYFARDERFGGMTVNGSYFAFNSQAIVQSPSYLTVRTFINNDSGNNTVLFAGSSPVRIQNTAASISNTTGSLIVDGGLGLSGNLSMNLASSFGTSRLTLNQNAFIVAGDGLGNLAIGGSAYWYFNNTGGIYNQNTLTQRGVIVNDTGNTTVLFGGSSQVKIQNGTASSNTTTGALVVQGGVGISGALNATTKSFNIPHPTKVGKDLRYGSLEGPEFGVYVRGTLKGSNIIELPDYWTKLVDANTITVSLTPIGKHQKLSVKEVKDNTIIINSDGWFKKEIHCYYVVYGERADVDKLDVEG